MSTRSVIPGVVWFERSIRNWSFRRKIWLLPIVAGLALSTIVVATTAIVALDYVRLQEIQTQSFPSLQQTARLRTIFHAVPDALRSAVAMHEIDRLSVADSLRDEFRGTIAAIDTITPREVAAFNTLDREFQDYYRVARATTLLLLDRRSDESVNVGIAAMVRKYDHVTLLVDDAYRLDELAITDSFHLALWLQRIAWGVGGLVTLICIGALSIITIALTRTLTSSLREAIRIADQVAAGDMTVEIPEPSDDEVGQLLRAMQRMVAYLNGMSRIADSIAQGDTSVPLAHLSEHDQFGAAFAAMVAYLDQMAAVAERLGDGDLTIAITPRSERDRFGQAFANTLDRLAKDVAERQRAEESLRRQAMVFETISDSVLVVGADDCILDANPAATTIFGYDRDEMVGKIRPVWEHLDHERRSAIGCALRTDRAWEGELPLLRKDGRTGIVHTVIKSLHDERGAHVANVAISRDLTEQRHLEQQLVQANKLEAIGSLAAGIAHEINTPVQYVGDNVSFLAEGLRAFSALYAQARGLVAAAHAYDALAPLVKQFEDDEQSLDIEYVSAQWPKSAEHAHDGVERIAEIVRAMKEFSHPGTITKVDIDLNAAISNTVTMCRNEWKYVATLTLELEETLPRLVCMPGELQQVILNLVVNAAQAIEGAANDVGHRDGAIVVSTREVAGWVEIRVSDNGPGISEAIRTKIFDPFFTTKDVGKGTGQGLALAYNTITVKHHGSIAVESTEGLGTTFTVRLPLDVGPIDAAAA